MASPATGRLPMPHLVVFGKQLGKTGARHGRQPSDELSAFNTAVGDVLLDDVNPDALGSQLGDVLVDARGLGLSLVAKGQPGGVLPFHCVVDRVTAQEHVDAGASVDVLLRGNAVNYAVKGQDASGLAFGDKRQTQPPRIDEDVAKLTTKSVRVYVVEEDVTDRGIEGRELIAGLSAVSRTGLSKLFAEYDQVWHW